MGALLAQPLSNAPDWDLTARRLAHVYVDGLTAQNAGRLPGAPPTRADLERAFAEHAARSRAVGSADEDR